MDDKLTGPPDPSDPYQPSETPGERSAEWVVPPAAADVEPSTPEPFAFDPGDDEFVDTEPSDPEMAGEPPAAFEWLHLVPLLFLAASLVLATVAFINWVTQGPPDDAAIVEAVIIDQGSDNRRSWTVAEYVDPESLEPRQHIERELIGSGLIAQEGDVVKVAVVPGDPTSAERLQPESRLPLVFLALALLVVVITAAITLAIGGLSLGLPPVPPRLVTFALVVGAAIALASGLAILLAGVRDAADGLQAEGAVVVDGEVVDYRTRRDTEWLTIAFVDPATQETREYIKRSEIRKGPNEREGEIIEMAIVPGDPASAELAGSGTGRVVAALIGGGLLTVVGGRFLWALLRRG